MLQSTLNATKARLEQIRMATVQAGSPSPPGEGSPASVTPPAQSAPVESPEQESGSSLAPPGTTKPAETHIEEGTDPVVLTESPEELIDEDNASVSTDNNPFGPENALNVVSTTQEAAGPSTEEVTPASAKDKGRAVKNSKVNGLLQEGGISLKDFAPEVEQKKGRSLRKLSVKAGSSSRPAWKR
ncbi:hypothetical protein N0V91_010162 [Didymella pomorum]|uniref:Uncharacterized protein n=1 Tax=Didymella pomorum TaxID=749634 RepID=A0A9W9D2T6_9PLEO|nr:hypothetical protein N0V91_010162 [Didymella pomorum]